MQEEVKHYKVKSLPTLPRPNSVYYVKATSQSTVKTYITDQNGFPYPLVDLTGGGGGGTGTVQSVTGTGVTGSPVNPIIDISTFKSSELGNLLEIATSDGKLFVKPITSPDGSIDIVSTSSALELQISGTLQALINSAVQPGDNISGLVNDAGYITAASIPPSALAATAWTTNHIVATGNPYLAGTLVYYSGHIFRANFNNDSIPPAIGGNLYWTDLGLGNLIDQEQTDWAATSGSSFLRNRPTSTSSFINDGNGVSNYVTFADLAPLTVGTLPPGGTAGQILTKVDATNYNTYWQDNFADWTSVVKHLVKNDGTGLITKGTPVYSTGSNGTNILVGKASNDAEVSSSKTMGLMQSDITTTGGTQTGFVIAEGLLGGLNTAGTTAGDPVWLGVNGTLIYGLVGKPYAPAHLVFIGIVTKVSAGNGEIFVKVQNGFEVEELHNVDLKTTIPVNGDVLGFNGTLWVNKTIAAWLGYTPANDSTFLYDKFMTNQFAYFLPMDGSTFYDTLRVGGTLTSTGTVSSLSENPMGVLYTTALAVGSVAGLYGNPFGGSGYLGVSSQFETIRKFRINTNNGAQRLFVGISALYNTTAPTNVEPTTLLNSIGVAKLQGSPNLFFVWNDATGTASSIDLGSGFLGTDTACTYKLRIYKTYNVPVIFIELTKIVNSTGVVTTTSYNITGDYNTGASYYPFLWIGNNTAVSGACSIKDYGCIATKRNAIAN